MNSPNDNQSHEILILSPLDKRKSTEENYYKTEAKEKTNIIDSFISNVHI